MGAGVELTKLLLELCSRGVAVGTTELGLVEVEIEWAGPGLCLSGDGSTAAVTRLWIRELSLQKEASLAADSSIWNTATSAWSFSCLEACTTSRSQKLFSTLSLRSYRAEDRTGAGAGTGAAFSLNVLGGETMLTCFCLDLLLSLDPSNWELTFLFSDF